MESLNTLQAQRRAKELGLSPKDFVGYDPTMPTRWNNQALADALNMNITKSSGSSARVLASPTATQPAPTVEDMLAKYSTAGATDFDMLGNPTSYLTDKGKADYNVNQPLRMNELQQRGAGLNLTPEQINTAYSSGYSGAVDKYNDYLRWKEKDENRGGFLGFMDKATPIITKAGFAYIGGGALADMAGLNSAALVPGEVPTATAPAMIPGTQVPLSTAASATKTAYNVATAKDPGQALTNAAFRYGTGGNNNSLPGLQDLSVVQDIGKRYGFNFRPPAFGSNVKTPDIVPQGFAGGGQYSASDIRPTPEQRPMMGALARAIQAADKFARKPFGYDNPPVEMISDVLRVPELYRTMENFAYGSPLASGASSVSRYLPRLTEDTKGAIEASTNLIPLVGPTLRATKATARAAAPYAARHAVELAEKYGVAPTMNVIKPKDEKQVLTRVLSEGAPLLRKGSLEKTLATLEASQKANLERQPLIESLYRYHANENPKIAESLERMYEGLEKPVDLDAAVKAYGEGFIVPGSRISFSKDIGVRSPQAQYPGLHFAAPGREQQLQHFIELYANEFAPDRPKAFSPTIRPVLAKAGKPIQLSDEAFEYPDILAKELGLTKEFRKAVDQFYSKPRDFSKIDRDAVEADIITKLLAKKNIDLGVYTNVAEGVLGPENTSFVSFGKNKLRGFAQGGIVEYDPDHIESLAQGFDAEEFASGGLVNYDPTEIDTIVSKLKEEFHG